MGKLFKLLVFSSLVVSLPCGSWCINSPSAWAYEIVNGTATVDGVAGAGEWDDANWHNLNQIYYGDPSDLSNAKWAAKWNSDTIYVVVTGIDTEHYFVPSQISWNGQDCVEFYVDAGNTDSYQYHNTYADAQQFVGSPDGTPEGEWLDGGNYTTLNEGAVYAFEAVADVNGTITYEIALKPYNQYDKDDPCASTLLTLGEGDIIGLDVIMDSKSDSGFGMLCQNSNGGKYMDASKFMDHTLVVPVQLPGDANYDNKVDGCDAAILAANWLSDNADWAMGDFSGDNVVNAVDATLLAANWQLDSSPVDSSPVSVPEPSLAIVLFIMLSMLLISRRR